ncbi:YidB family protein [Xanthobacter sp. V4C-4]|uniref:YidB family protein n=1 Tax=Xanthobacter cornucopiae TaxID=3119924 RepID=UPI00372A7E14
MGLFDQMLGGVLNNVLSQAGNSGALGNLLNSALSGPMAQALPGMLEGALAKTPYGSLDGLLAQLQESGLGEQVTSWLSNGPNLPVSAEQIVSALGESQLGQLGAGFGLTPERITELLSQYLPSLVDKLSPNGVLEVPKA